MYCKGRRSIEIDNFQTLINLASLVSRTNMKFSHFVELVNVTRPVDLFYLESSYIFSYLILS